MTTLSPKRIEPGYEPIAGYVLEELIGSGGFGEVWRAEAPGGIKKAVKFIFGDRGERRAEQELKSLERIKGVQHPFILTLERFDVVDDRLVIVTELADGSLEEVFKERRSQGSCGIARQLLLAYMRDTADALDYLHDLYKLQHLDIKPANLLIVGGRVKVADFGLLKDLREVTQSVIGGLTPIYAPPELFDGRPSLHSDQYSLAVMYQELLTGTRPFSGRTIAQLATQHIHNAPNLKPLPPSDRPVVARALEKSPQRRFQSCSEFVDALLNEHDNAIASVAAAKLAADVEDSAVQDLPHLESSQQPSEQTGVGLALVIGMGGTGADCISRLRQRVAELHSLSPLTLHTVEIDVDQKSAGVLRDEADSEFCPYNRSIITPLRSAMDYRNRGTEHLKSISRRWLYNVPRSGATEGMRPLGRLALIDHASEVNEGLRDAVKHLLSAAGNRTPAVYLVGSLAGGTGSGIFVDVAYRVRSILDEAGLHDVDILSLLTTARLQGDPSRPLVLHDTNAAIQEIKYFLQPGNSYPGDPGAEWPSMPAARTPLHHTYLIAESHTPSSPSPVETVVDYLWIDATAGNAFLDSARQFQHDDQDTAAAKPSLRSVGVVALSGTRRLEENVLAPSTTRHLLRRWLGNPDRAMRAAQPLAERVVRQCQLTAEEMVQQVLQQYNHDLDSRQQRVKSYLDHSQSEDTNRQSIEEFIRSTTEQDDGQQDADAIISTLQRQMAIRLMDGRLDLASAIKSAQLVVTQLRNIADQLAPGTDKAIRQPDSHVHQNLPMLSEHADQILHGFASQMAAGRARRLHERLSLFEQKLSVRAMVLAKALRSVNDGKQGSASAWDDMHPPLRDQSDTVINELHGICAANWLVKLTGEHGNSITPDQLVSAISEAAVPLICRAVMIANGQEASESAFAISGSAVDNSNANAISRTTRFVPLENSESLGVTASITEIESCGAGEASVLTVEEAVAAVKPALLSCGGFQRLILIVGSKAEQDLWEPEVRKFHQGSLTTTIIESASPMLIHEAQQIAIDDLSKRLTTLAGGDQQISKRLVSRSDIDWSMGAGPSR